MKADGRRIGKDRDPEGAVRWLNPVLVPSEFLPRAKIIHYDNWAKNSFLITLPGLIVASMLLLQSGAVSQSQFPLKHPFVLFCFAAVVLAYTLQVAAADWWLTRSDKLARLGDAGKFVFAARLGLSVSWVLLLNTAIRTSGQDGSIVIVGTEIALIAATVIVGPLTFGLAALIPLVAGALASVAPGSPAFSPILVISVLVYGCYTFYSAYFLNRKMITETLTTIRLEQTNEMIRILLRDFEESASDWLWEVDAAFNLKSVSARFAEVAHLDPAVMAGPLVDVLRGDGPPEPGSTKDSLAPLLDQFSALAPIRDLVEPVVIAGERRWWSLTGKPMFEEPNHRFVGYRGVGSDVTANHLAREQNAYLARHDALTGLANRVAFTSALEQALRAGSGALLSLDLDAFKGVNDRFGHAMGDLVLSAVANRIRGAIRDGDIAARLGGDEFAILLGACDENIVLSVARRVVNLLDQPFRLDGVTVEIGTSIGISLVQPLVSLGRSGKFVLDITAAAETLMKQADLALYQAKAAGRGTWRFFNDAMHQNIDRRRHLQNDLRKPVESGNLAVRFLPVINLSHRHMTAVEAVLQWPQRRSHEGVSSDQISMTSEITELMFKEGLACGQILPPAIRIILNIGLGLLLDRSEIAALLDSVAKSGIEPDRLEFEITEAALIDGGEKCLEHMRWLRSFGCRTAICQFGLGATPLTRLHEIPVDRLKIHGSFAERIEIDPQAVSTLRAMIDMAHSLGLLVTADGVNNETQVSLLNDLECDEAQGAFFSAPLSATEILRFPALKIARLIPRSQHLG